MKLLCTEYNPAGEYGFLTLGDNALLRNNEDFYLPAFASRWSCVPQLVVRVCKLGKGISPRFAFRYVEEMGVGIRFYADDHLEALRAKGLPDGAALGFDHAAAISVLAQRAAEIVEASYCFEVNGEVVHQGDITALLLPLEQQVARLSELYMFKVGDFIYCGSPFRYTGLRIGDRLTLSLNDRVLLDFFIR